MTRVYSLDGRCFELDDSLLSKSQLSAERVSKLLDEDTLPDAPPVGDLPRQPIPPQILAMMAQGMPLPIPEEARGILFARAFPDGSIVIDLNVPGASGGPGTCGA